VAADLVGSGNIQWQHRGVVGVTSSSMNGSTSNRRGSITSIFFKIFNRLSPPVCIPAVTNMIFIVHFHRRPAKPDGGFSLVVMGFLEC